MLCLTGEHLPLGSFVTLCYTCLPGFSLYMYKTGAPCPNWKPQVLRAGKHCSTHAAHVGSSDWASEQT